MADNRFRNFGCVVYPESAPEGWKEILQDQFIPAFISPLHDKDLDPTGEPKKPHYHVMIMFEGKKSIEQAQAIFSLIGGVGCLVLNSIRGMARYHCHLDNPDKAQYDTNLEIALCGADYAGICNLAIDKYCAIGEIMDYIDDHQGITYRQLMHYCRYERFDWFRVLCDSGSFVIRMYLGL